MKGKFIKLKEKMVLVHANVMSLGSCKKDEGASTIEVVAYTLGFLMIASFIIFGFLGITKNKVMTGISTVIDNFLNNVSSGS